MRIVAMMALAISACTGNYDKGEAAPPSAAAPEASGKCDAAPVQTYVGQKLTDALGETIRSQSGATMLRLGGPDSIWTMDYREERVNIRHDADLVIEAITCG